MIMWRRRCASVGSSVDSNTAKAAKGALFGPGMCRTPCRVLQGNGIPRLLTSLIIAPLLTLAASTAAYSSPPTGSDEIVRGSSFNAPPPPAATQVPVPLPVPSTSAGSADMAAPPVANAGPPAPPAKVLLRLAGSDVLAGRLVRRLAAGYLLLTGDSDITGRLAEGSDDFEVAGQQTEQSEVIRITSSNSAAGFAALLRGSADIALSTRKPSADEANRLTTVGDMNTPTNEHVIAIQGIAAIVGNPSRVATLTVAQLKDILTARVRDWSEVGGTKGPISVYVMDGDEGADRPQDLLVDAADLDPTVRRLASEDAVALAVAADRSAVGFVTLGAVGHTHPVPIADNGSIPFAPTDVTILTQDYPLTRRLYFYNGDDLSGGTVRRFVDYVASPAGQASVEAEGMMVLGVKSEAAVVPSPASERFRLFVAGSNRLSVDFRFQPNSLQLTARSARDLDLLAGYVKSQRIDPSRLMLAGFADDTGRPAASMAASQRQAQAAAAALAKVGLVPGKVSSFGAELPVADNTTAEGKEHNRRVEVYLSPR